MTQTVNSVDSDHGHTEDKHAVSRNAKNENISQTEEENSRYAKYTETELVERLGHITVITYAKNGNPDIIEAPVEMLGYSQEAREIVDWHVDELIASDESTWQPLKVCFWPDYMDKPSPEIKSRIIGGNHRTKAARGKNPPLETLRMRVGKVVDEVDFLRAQIEDNASHGLNYTEDQRKAHAFKLREMGVKVKQIASDLKVPEKTLYNWFSTRDMNKSKKTKEKAQQTIAAFAGSELLSMEWQVPSITPDEQGMKKVKSRIHDFLAGAASRMDKLDALNKAHIHAFVETMTPEECNADVQEIDKIINWLGNYRIITIDQAKK